MYDLSKKMCEAKKPRLSFEVIVRPRSVSLPLSAVYLPFARKMKGLVETEGRKMGKAGAYARVIGKSVKRNRRSVGGGKRMGR